MTITILCRVVDNFGDAGFVLRLSRNLCAHALNIITDNPLLFSRLSAPLPKNISLFNWATGKKIFAPINKSTAINAISKSDNSGNFSKSGDSGDSSNSSKSGNSGKSGKSSTTSAISAHDNLDTLDSHYTPSVLDALDTTSTPSAPSTNKDLDTHSTRKDLDTTSTFSNSSTTSTPSTFGTIKTLDAPVAPTALDLRYIVECFECGRPQWLDDLLFGGALDYPVKITMVDYLTAESYAKKFHRMKSLTRSSRVKKTLFMPGFEAGTGGLLLPQTKSFDTILFEKSFKKIIGEEAFSLLNRALKKAPASSVIFSNSEKQKINTASFSKQTQKMSSQIAKVTNNPPLPDNATCANDEVQEQIAKPLQSQLPSKENQAPSVDSLMPSASNQVSKTQNQTSNPNSFTPTANNQTLKPDSLAPNLKQQPPRIDNPIPSASGQAPNLDNFTTTANSQLQNPNIQVASGKNQAPCVDSQNQATITDSLAPSASNPPPNPNSFTPSVLTQAPVDDSQPPRVENSRFALYFSYSRRQAPIIKAFSLTKCAVLLASGAGADTFLTAYDKGFSLAPLPFITQPDWDALIATIPLLFVRGEDSLAQAALSGNVFLWEAYPQTEGYQMVKVAALMDRMERHFSAELFPIIKKAFTLYNEGECCDEELTCALTDFIKSAPRLKAGYADFSKSLKSLGDLADNLVEHILSKWD